MKIFTVGGLIGELILIFTTLQDYMQSQPSSIGVDFTQAQYESYLSQLSDLDFGPLSLAMNKPWTQAFTDTGLIPLDIDQ